MMVLHPVARARPFVFAGRKTRLRLIQVSNPRRLIRIFGSARGDEKVHQAHNLITRTMLQTR
jgi:hypothetical protein